MKLSILIVSYNVKKLITACLHSLETLGGFEYEIIVVDNGSTDGTKECLSSAKYQVPNIKCIFQKNLGFARGNIEAYRYATGEYILLLNPDTEVLPGSIEALVHFLDEHPDAGIVGSKLLNPDKSIQRSIRGFPTLMSQIFVLLKLHNYLGTGVLQYAPTAPLQKYLLPDFDYSKPQTVDQVMGAALLTRRSVIEKVGFLDPGFLRWFEEVDFCYRVQRAGWDIWYTPEAEIIHVRGQSFHSVSKSASQQVSKSFMSAIRLQCFYNQGMLRFFWKQKPIWQVFILIPFLIASVVITAILWILLRLNIPLIKNNEL